MIFTIIMTRSIMLVDQPHHHDWPPHHIYPHQNDDKFPHN